MRSSYHSRSEDRFSSGCIISYPLNGEGFLEDEIPFGSCWYRIHRKRLKFYEKGAEFGNKTSEDLKKIPKGSKRFRVNFCHKSFSSHYEIVFIDKDGNSIE
ncbi:MAG: hypothetical protein QW286_01980 [Candidatus Aenigmatarchaeota archaeon]